MPSLPRHGDQIGRDLIQRCREGGRIAAFPAHLQSNPTHVRHHLDAALAAHLDTAAGRRLGCLCAAAGQDGKQGDSDSKESGVASCL